MLNGEDWPRGNKLAKCALTSTELLNLLRLTVGFDRTCKSVVGLKHGPKGRLSEKMVMGSFGNGEG